MLRKIVHLLAVIGIMGILVSLTIVPAQADIQQGLTQHGLNAKYYALSDPDTILISRIDPQIAWIYNSWYNNSVIAAKFNYSSQYGTPFGAEWSGYLLIPESGIYTFGGFTDDFGGAQLYISGQWVDIVYWHSSWRIDPRQYDRDHSGGYDMYDPLTIFLTKGFYPIKARMEEIDGEGGSGFDFRWMRPGTQWDTVVPQEFLYPQEYNTPIGSPVCVELPSARICFTSVISLGTTTATSATTPCGSLPSGFIARGTSQHVTTTARYTGAVTVGIRYDDSSIPTEGDMRLFHCDGTNWHDVTTSVDAVNNIIYGEDSALSWWWIGDPAGPRGGLAWYWYIVIGAVLAACVLVYFIWRRFVRPKVVADFKVEDIGDRQMLICNIWNIPIRSKILKMLYVRRSQIDDLIAYFEVLDRADMQRIGKTVRAKITTKQGKTAERVAFPASDDPAMFPVVVFNQEINATYMVSDSEELTLLLPGGLYIIGVKIYFGQQVKQVSREFSVVSESPHIRLSVFHR